MPKVPHFTKDQKIAVIGAGPAGIHMASQLKKRGYTNVTIFEKSGVVGGKSLSLVQNGIPYELGTCFLHNGYRRILHLIKEYKLREPISPEGRAIFLKKDGTADEFTSMEFTEFVTYQIKVDWAQQHPKWKWLPGKLISLKLVKAIWNYCWLYRRLLGSFQLTYEMPYNPSDELLKQVDITFLEFLQKNNLSDLISLLRIAQAAQGYGYMETIPAYYGLCWLTPTFFWGLIRQSLGLGTITKMLPDGYQELWRRIAKDDELSIKFNTTIKLDGIDRKTQPDKVRIEYTDAEQESQTETFDFLILTISLREALQLLKYPTETESKLFNALVGFTLTSTLYESEPIPRYSTPEYDKAGAYFPDVLNPKHNNVWYADRNDRNIFAKSSNMPKSFERQRRIAFQFSDQEPPVGEEDIATWKKELLSKLKQAFSERIPGEVDVIQSILWPYFLHFPKEVLRLGYPRELFEYQGQNNTWYAGASASFESVEHVVNYNLALMDTYLED